MGKFITKDETAALRYMVTKGEISEDQASEIIIEGNPHLWIEANLGDVDDPDRPIRLRPYQVDVLKPASTVSLRFGRQCIELDEYIYTESGIKKAKEVCDGDQILGGTVCNYHQFEDNGYQIACYGGLKLKVNGSHPFMTKRGWIPAKDLTLSDEIEFISTPEIGTYTAPTINPKLFGYILSDGYFAKGQTPKFTNVNELFLSEVEALSPWPTRRVSKRNAYDILFTDSDKSTCNPLVSQLKSAGVWNKDTFGEVLTYSETDTKEFISGYFNGDGYLFLRKSIQRYGVQIGFCIGLSERRAYEMQYILWKLGVYSYVKSELMSKSTAPFYRVLISSHESVLKLIDFLDHSKYPAKFTKAREILCKSKSATKGYRICGNWIRVKSISSIGRITVAGWTTHGNNEIISYCGMRTHNSGKSVVLSGKLLWEIFTEDNVTVALFAPTKKHINDIFNYVEKMLKTNPVLTAMIAQNKKGPKSMFQLKGADAIPKIELSNGSSIKFFHTQTKRAWEQIRGTKADKLYFDEAAYIAPEAFTALSGLLTSANNLFIWASSTPVNKSGWYYDFCQNSELHKHVTSMESPTWTPEKERLARLMAPDEGSFRREYLADWVSDGWSAFTDESVDASLKLTEHNTGEISYQQKNYLSTSQIKQMLGNVYIGLDWNIEANGTKIVVFKEFVGGAGKLMYQEVYSIEHPIYTQTLAVEKLFELIAEYKSNLLGIGIDKGYAGGSLEMIAKKLESADFKWLEGKIEVVNFGEVLNIPINEFFGDGISNDPSIEQLLYSNTGDEVEPMVKMPLKVFMVSVMTRMMLQEQLAVGPIDLEIERKTLITELRSVKIDKVSTNGYPVYSKTDLHKFSAAMLAVYVCFLKSGMYKIVQEGSKKIIRKDTPGKESKEVTALWSPSPKELHRGYFYSPKTLTKRDLGNNVATNLQKNKILKEEMKQLGMTTMSIIPSNNQSNRPGPSWNWKNRSTVKSRRSIG
jgi:hypothetical protein